MATMYCPSCGGEFVDGVEECPDCGVALVDEPVAGAGAGDADGAGTEQEVAYDLAEWSLEARQLVDRLLTSAEIPFAWEATTLVVPGALEAQVDEIVDQAGSTDDRVADLGDEQVAYELDDLTDAQYSSLYEALEEIGLPFELDAEGSLVVRSEDQDRVDEVLERIEAAATTRGGYVDASGLLRDEDEAGEGDQDETDELTEVEFGTEEIEGTELIDVLGEVFVSADRLLHHPTDAASVLTFADGVGLLRRAAIPFGYEPQVWARILVATGDLLEDLESDDVVEDEVIVDKARAVRDLLRPFV